MSTIDQTIREHLRSKGLDDIENDTMLFEKGILDSFQMVELIVFLEKAFSIRFGPTDLTRENLETIDAMVRLIQAKASS